MDNITIVGGCHSHEDWARSHLTPHFESGVITPYPGAEYYAVCYGELCAYAGRDNLLAVWSTGVPDSEWDERPSPDYTGKWRPYRHAKK